MTHDYLVEMTFTPFASLLQPHEVVSFAERFVKPTLEACQQLLTAGHIVAGGPALGASSFAFVARSPSHEHLEEMLLRLPLWTRAQTRVVPLGSFATRARFAEERLAKARAALAPVESNASRG